MFELPPMERYLVWGMLAFSCLGAVVGLMQTAGRQDPFRRLIMANTAMAMLMGTVLLGLRGAAIRAFPISDIFESMIILLIFVGLVFLFLSLSIRQPWFSSVMAWVFFLMVLLASGVARPASSLQKAVQTPWTAVHAISMVLSGAMILFSAAMSVLFLLSSQRLKKKQISSLFGKMPTIEKLEGLTLAGLRGSFITLTFGMISGVLLAAVKSEGLQMTLFDWLTDSKIVMISLAWALLLAILLLRTALAWSGRTVAKMTLVVCFFILFAFIGSQILCKSAHDFSSPPIQTHSNH